MPSNKKHTPNIVGMPWNMADVWNLTLDIPQERPFIPRDYCYASELGTSFCDRYLKMYGVPMSNPPNVRSRRKFQAGNMWEWVMGMILISSGMMKKKQIRVEAKFPKLLRVSGRLDFIVGAPDDWNLAKENIKKIKDGLELMGLDLPPFFFNAIDKFVDKYKGNKISDAIVETKSLSSFMMEKVAKTGAPLYHHALQNFHYVHGNEVGILLGKIFYIGKDDCLMQEFNIQNDGELLETYKKDIRTMTKYYNAGFNKRNPQQLMPPKEPLVLFEEGLYKFSKNWNVEYSNYLQYLYGYETPEAYREAWQYKLASWNRTFKRYVLEGTSVKREGKSDLVIKLTDKNKETKAEAIKAFPQWDKYVLLARKSGAFQKPEEVEDDN